MSPLAQHPALQRSDRDLAVTQYHVNAGDGNKAFLQMQRRHLNGFVAVFRRIFPLS